MGRWRSRGVVFTAASASFPPARVTPTFPATAPTNINGQTAALEAIMLKDDQGGAYTYYKLRDLGTSLGFKVDWSAEKGIFIETK